MPKLLIMEIKNKLNMKKFYLKNDFKKEVEIKIKYSRRTSYNAFDLQSKQYYYEKISNYTMKNIGAKNESNIKRLGASIIVLPCNIMPNELRTQGATNVSRDHNFR